MDEDALAGESILRIDKDRTVKSQLLFQNRQNRAKQPGWSGETIPGGFSELGFVFWRLFGDGHNVSVKTPHGSFHVVSFVDLVKIRL